MQQCENCPMPCDNNHFNEDGECWRTTGEDLIRAGINPNELTVIPSDEPGMPVD